MPPVVFPEQGTIGPSVVSATSTSDDSKKCKEHLDLLSNFYCGAGGIWHFKSSSLSLYAVGCVNGSDK